MVTGTIKSNSRVPAIHGREGLQIVDLQGLEMFQAFKSRISARFGIEPVSVQEGIMLQLVQGRQAAEGVLRLGPHVVVVEGRYGGRLRKGHLHFGQVWTGRNQGGGLDQLKRFKMIS